MPSLIILLVFSLFFSVFCIVSSSKSDINSTYYVDEGKNLTLSCSTTNGPVMWVRDGKKEQRLQEVLVSVKFFFLSDWSNNHLDVHYDVIEFIYNTPCAAHQQVVVYRTRDCQFLVFLCFQPNGSLHLTNLTPDDGGSYTCSAMVYDSFGYVNDLDEIQRVKGDNYTLVDISRAEIHVRTTPGPVSSFTCRATTIIGMLRHPPTPFTTCR